jgi:predicted nucleic acid-binding protein
LILDGKSQIGIWYVTLFCHALGLSDALIAATAVNHGLPLMTANTKYYRIIKNLILKKFLP